MKNAILTAMVALATTMSAQQSLFVGDTDVVNPRAEKALVKAVDAVIKNPCNKQGLLNVQDFITYLPVIDYVSPELKTELLQTVELLTEEQTEDLVDALADAVIYECISPEEGTALMEGLVILLVLTGIQI